MGCLSDNAKVVEPALDCLHKLVAYSYLQDENTRSGRLDDQTTVAQVSAGSFSVSTKRYLCKNLKGWKLRCRRSAVNSIQHHMSELVDSIIF